MTLLIALVAAITITVIWYTSSKARELKIGLMCYMYWGASLMWLIDAVFEYIDKGAEYFKPSLSDMANDSFLGLSAIVLGALIWLCAVLIKDPKGVVKSALSRKK